MKQERLQNFKPLAGATQSVTPAVLSAKVTINNMSVRLYNGTNKIVYIRIQKATQDDVDADVNTDMPLPVGGVEIFDLVGADTVAYCVSDVTSLTGKLSITPGTGN